MVYRVLIIPSLISLLACPALVSADPVRIERGAPTSAKKRKSLERALHQAAASATVCFTHKREKADSVRIALKVAPNGQVSQSRHETGGPVGQCLAGVLAVQTLPATGGRHDLKVSFDVQALSGGSIDAALLPYQARLRKCMNKASDPDRGGHAVIQFVIQPDGRIAEPRIKESDPHDAELEKCLIDTISQARLGKNLVAKKVRYALQVAFPAGSSSDGKRTASRSSDMQPRKVGPLDGSEINQVIKRRKDAFNQCYAKQAKKNRSLAGRVVLRFTVRPDGTVRNAKIKESTLGNKKVETCIVNVGKKLQFPQAADDTRVFYPFVFSTR